MLTRPSRAKPRRDVRHVSAYRLQIETASGLTSGFSGPALDSIRDRRVGFSSSAVKRVHEVWTERTVRSTPDGHGILARFQNATNRLAKSSFRLPRLPGVKSIPGDSRVLHAANPSTPNTSQNRDQSGLGIQRVNRRWFQPLAATGHKRRLQSRTHLPPRVERLSSPGREVTRKPPVLTHPAN